MNKIILISLCFVLFSCSKNDDVTLLENDNDTLLENDNKLVGTWIEKNPELFDGIMDTIVFTKYGLVKKHIVFDGWCYSAISNTIIFGKDGKEIKCAYSITNNDELTIYNFIDRLETTDVKNMQFVRIEE